MQTATVATCPAHHLHDVPVHDAIEQVAKELDQQRGGGWIIVQQKGILQLLWTEQSPHHETGTP